MSKFSGKQCNIEFNSEILLLSICLEAMTGQVHKRCTCTTVFVLDTVAYNSEN